MNSNLSKQLSGKNDKPVLIFDRTGELGVLLASELAKDNITVFLSENKTSRTEKLIYIPLSKKIPVIPKCIYNTFILNYNNDRSVLDLLPFFISKAVEDNAHIYLIVNIRDASEQLIDQILDKSNRISVILVGDLLGESADLNNPVNVFIGQASSGKIVLNGILSYLYPVGTEDVLVVVKRLLGLKGVPGHRILYFLPPHPVTALSFVRLLQKKEPLIKVDIVDGGEVKKIMPGLKSYASVFGPNYSFEKHLPHIKILKTERITKAVQKKRKLNSRKMSLLLFLVFTLSVAFICLPVFTAVIGAGYLTRVKGHLTASNYEKARSSAYTAGVFFSLSQRTMKGLSLISYFGFSNQFNNINSGVYAGKLISDTALSAIDGVESIKKVVMAKSLDPEKDLSEGVKDLKQAVLGVSSLQAERIMPEHFSSYIDQFGDISGLTDGVFDVLPELMGIYSKKKYLVLFQNNMELRPGGGFIGSFGVLELDKGRIADFRIHDVYDADGQLTQHIEPPFQLRKYMGVNHWYLRDSNFDLEFEKNGASAAFFYNAELKDTVDGVVAIDVSFLAKLLKATGPLKVAGYNEVVTSSNFFKLTESYAQDNFFPGSNQKHNFLNAVAVSLFAKLSQAQGVPYPLLGEMIVESIREKHLLFASPKEDIQRIFNTNGASSDLVNNAVGENNSFNDFLGINEANLGMNKVNYYLDRTISHKVELSSGGKAEEAVSVHYLNKSKIGDKYGGDYKAYLRFILPKKALLQGVAFDNDVQEIVPAVIDPAVFTSFGYRPQAGLEVERSELTDHVVYGFLILVPQGSKRTVTINYSMQSTDLFGSPTLDYSLSLFKQPGTEADSYAFTFMSPQGYKITNASDDIKTNHTGATFITRMAEDKEVNITLSKN